MMIGGHASGEKCFSKMFSEYKAAYDIVKSFYGNEIENNKIINISYLLFYNGVGETSDKINRNILNNIPRLDELLIVFRRTSKTKGQPDHEKNQMAFSISYDQSSLSNLGYRHFNGHNTRLGQYFRNLFHILSYTSDISDEILSENEKYEIIKSLRSQLSNYEQILIYFNSITLYGAPLSENKYISTYQLIKNIPLPLIEFSGDIRENYSEIKFEWDQIQERASEYNKHA